MNHRATVHLQAAVPPPPPGFDAVLRALADLVTIRADDAVAGPLLTWTADAVVAIDASGARREVPLPAVLVDLDHSPPMAPFVRARARRLRHWPEVMVVEAGDPRTALATRVTASGTSSRRDVIRALASGAIVVSAGLDRDPVLADAPHLGADRILDAAEAAALSRRAARYARQRFDPRSVALRVVDALGLPVTTVRHALTELHRGGLGRIDARASRLTEQEVSSSWR